MNRIFGMVMAVGIVLGQASVADAQVSVSIGNPYNAAGSQMGQPYGYGYESDGGRTAYYGSGYSSYSSGYSSYVAPGTTSFVTGSFAPEPYIYGAPVYGVAPPLVVPYRIYGTRPYGLRRGFGVPFVSRRRW